MHWRRERVELVQNVINALIQLAPLLFENENDTISVDNIRTSMCELITHMVNTHLFRVCFDKHWMTIYGTKVLRYLPSTPYLNQCLLGLDTLEAHHIYLICVLVKAGHLPETALYRCRQWCFEKYPSSFGQDKLYYFSIVHEIGATINMLCSSSNRNTVLMQLSQWIKGTLNAIKLYHSTLRKTVMHISQTSMDGAMYFLGVLLRFTLPSNDPCWHVSIPDSIDSRMAQQLAGYAFSQHVAELQQMKAIIQAYRYTMETMMEENQSPIIVKVNKILRILRKFLR